MVIVMVGQVDHPLGARVPVAKGDAALLEDVDVDLG